MSNRNVLGILVGVIFAGALAGILVWKPFDRSAVPSVPPLEASRAPSLPARKAANPLSVVLITVDTLRHDHMSVYGYHRPTTPSIDEAFADADIYERAYSAEANTSPSVVTALSGLLPARHRVRLLYQRIGPDVHLLSDHLNAAGYQTAAVVSNVVLTTEAIGFSTRFDYYDDFVDEREASRNQHERRASRTTDAAISWLLETRDAERPCFLWVHYIDPHAPYTSPADERAQEFSHDQPQPFDLSRMFEYARLPGIDDAEEYVDCYDEEIAYVDREIGRLIQALRAEGLWKQALSVFSADHGETMAEHDIYFNHGHDVWEAIMRVPLLVRKPGVSGGRHEDPVSLVDLMPTILGELGLPIPEGLDGIPLHRRNGTRALSLEATGWGVQKRALIAGLKKWTAHVSTSRECSNRSFFNLSDDPGEQVAGSWFDHPFEHVLVRWAEQDPDPGGRPKELLSGIKLGAPKVAPGRTPEQLEALRSLGYLR